MNDCFERLEVRFDERFEKLETKFEVRFDKVDARFEKIDEQLVIITGDIVDLEVAVARLEGPQPTLIRAR